MAVSPKKIQYSALNDSEALQQLFPGSSDWRFQNLDTLGYSGANFTRFTFRGDSHEERLILKELDVENDWFSKRSSDTLGREAAVLVEPALRQVHEIFELPYRFIGMEGGKIRMLMTDVSFGLFPDERKSISRQDQDLILDKMAELHAFFWENPLLSSFPWLHRFEDFLYLMGPLDHKTNQSTGVSARNVQEAIKSGWKQAKSILPTPVKELLYQNPGNMAERWKHLPKTLVHGDTKIANFVKISSNQLCLLDWAFVGHAPCTVDIGWFLAVNATRLHDAKEVVLQKYRSSLEAHLRRLIDQELWNQLEAAGILCGALMLLWSKAKALDSKRDDAEPEWDWWIKRLSLISR